MIEILQSVVAIVISFSIPKHDCLARRGQLFHAHGASLASITCIGFADKMIKAVRRTLGGCADCGQCFGAVQIIQAIPSFASFA